MNRIHMENFTYSSTYMRSQWLNLLEQIHFHGVSVSCNHLVYRNESRLYGESFFRLICMRENQRTID